MQKLSFENVDGRKLKVLCLGAHCDDIEIGCGGALLSLQDRERVEEIRWVVFSSDAERKAETQTGARALSRADVPIHTLIYSYKDAFLQESWAEIKEKFNALAREFQPDVIFTHYGSDKHQDHKLISELTWNTFRNHLIFEYEIPKFDGDLGQPNVFFPLSNDQAKHKVDTILDSYKSQANRHWFEADTFYALMRIRGLECGGTQKFAEGFFVRKALL